MKKITFILSSLVIVGLFTIFGICKPLSSTNVNVLNTQTKSKYVKSSFINHINDIEKEKEEEEKFEEEVEKKQKNIELREQVSPSIDKKVVVSEKKESTKEEKKTETVVENKVENKPEVTNTPTPTPSPSPSPTPTVTTKSGKVTYYILNCSGCSGNLASGKKTTNSMYNGYRAIAAGYEYKFGTLIRISGTPLGTFTGIVLDRGGAIGETKKFTFDILVDDYNTAIRYGTSNITYQVIREGW